MDFAELSKSFKMENYKTSVIHDDILNADTPEQFIQQYIKHHVIYFRNDIKKSDLHLLSFHLNTSLDLGLLRKLNTFSLDIEKLNILDLELVKNFLTYSKRYKGSEDVLNSYTKERQKIILKACIMALEDFKGYYTVNIPFYNAVNKFGKDKVLNLLESLDGYLLADRVEPVGIEDIVDEYDNIAVDKIKNYLSSNVDNYDDFVDYLNTNSKLDHTKISVYNSLIDKELYSVKQTEFYSLFIEYVCSDISKELKKLMLIRLL